MSETSDTNNSNESAQVISPKRILILTAFVVIAGSLLSLIFANGKFAIGFFIGGILALVNYYWLKTSLKKVFDAITPIEEDEQFVKPRFLGARYIFRYIFLGIILYLIWMLKLIPIVAVLVGMFSFAAAILLEAIIILFKNVFFKKEI